MFWVCWYFFLFPDLSGEDKTQSADTEDGQSWPKGAGICRVVVWNIFVFCLWSLIYRYVAYCWLANVLHHPRWGFCQLPHLCPRLHLLSKICEQISVAILAHWFFFFFSTCSWLADVSGAVWCWDANRCKCYTTHRWTFVNGGRC